MDYETWEPFYDAILADFGYDRAGDEAARDWLAQRVDRFELDSLRLGGTVAIAGAAPSLEADLAVARGADAVVAASDAGVRLAAAGLVPDLVVTDLDGDPEGTIGLAEDGVPVAVHAHGDNRSALERYVPRFPTERLLGTTQAEPVDPLVNYGGFTDGDRAAFLADAVGADRLIFPGWDFDAAEGPKVEKLSWAGVLLHWLERHRGARFELLDGRRTDIDLSGFPAP
ncbi:2-amino-4-hydroxy-6-hydroxymethyldihydropteridinepyrophosphokinase, archaeal-type [Salinarchaeum sp. Harcht-Bsk1]|uniref:6-hydroxymethylpterin diphosphokinase MptE-like protein n=1 Tax=Salinarchaeum sp. Harcht-Bsk1 TaxID=1333523 RepID=UPI0003422A7A|nr:6-hydroxymethylpterin diphosphokinase MptE-like protein [Salinarchaeum sp. Harcht-Bsk1]AGN02502.1 2-amino-4-hydroxy-6-hydroxymethyldihydropteridinepyrophosphokinase, archaeal-type [Salinarchaeum sp. Harcht-Bsk1]